MYKWLLFVPTVLIFIFSSCKTNNKQQNKQEQPQPFIFQSQQLNFQIKFTKKPEQIAGKIEVNGKKYDIFYFTYDSPTETYSEIVAVVNVDQQFANQANPTNVIETFAQTFKNEFKILTITKEEINNLPQYPSYLIEGKNENNIFITLQLIFKQDKIYAIVYLSKKQDSQKAKDFIDSFEFIQV